MRRIYCRTPSVVTPAGEGGMILGRGCVGGIGCNRIGCPKNQNIVVLRMGIADDDSRNPGGGDSCILVDRRDSTDFRDSLESTVDGDGH